jgi:tetratricopeptide (TPR) repeat protein
MFLLRISLLLYVSVMLLTLSSCASMSTDTASSGKADEWNDVPKSYVDGLKLAQKGQSKQAIELFKKTTQEHPAFAPAYTNMGLQQLRLKDRSSAKVSLKKAIELSPNNFVAYNHLGVISRLDGDFDTAKILYQKALQFNSDYAIAHLNLGILLDLYLYDLPPALEQYEAYQSMIDKKDATVAKWIIDIKRRISKNEKS